MKLICYLSNGYPSIDASIEVAKDYVAGGCDIIEIDFPSRDPFLEGEYIANRMAEALRACGDYDRYMRGMIEAKRQLPETVFIVLVYENTIEEIGVDKFISFCKDNSFLDVILCGIKDNEIKNKIIQAGIRVSCYVRFSMETADIEFAKASNGFVYLQAKPKDQSEINPKYPTLTSCVAHLRETGITRPIYCGVGIHEPADVLMAKTAGADAVFVGSSILKIQNDKPLLCKTIKDFKSMC